MALEEAEEAYGKGEVPVGCIMVRGSEPVVRAGNRTQASGSLFAHAEILAMSELSVSSGRHVLEECVLYVTIEPCAMCFGAMMLARIPKLVFGAREPRTGVCGSVLSLPAEPGLEHRIAVIGGVEESKCGRIMQRFFEDKRKRT